MSEHSQFNNLCFPSRLALSEELGGKYFSARVLHAKARGRGGLGFPRSPRHVRVSPAVNPGRRWGKAAAHGGNMSRYHARHLYCSAKTPYELRTRRLTPTHHLVIRRKPSRGRGPGLDRGRMRGNGAEPRLPPRHGGCGGQFAPPSPPCSPHRPCSSPPGAGDRQRLSLGSRPHASPFQRAAPPGHRAAEPPRPGFRGAGSRPAPRG